MIKIKDIIKEHKIVMTEAFKSGKLRALTNKWQGLDSTFFAYGSKLVSSGTKLQTQKLKPTLNQRKKVLKLHILTKMFQ